MMKSVLKVRFDEEYGLRDDSVTRIMTLFGFFNRFLHRCKATKDVFITGGKVAISPKMSFLVLPSIDSESGT